MQSTTSGRSALGSDISAWLAEHVEGQAYRG